MSTENNQTTATRLVKFKTLDNKITEMTVDPDILVKDLKELIKDKLNIAAETQRLIVMGKQLNDNKKLSEYITQDGQVIHLIARLTESAQSQGTTQASQSQTQQQSTSQPNQIPTSNNTINDPLGLNGILGNFLNSPGMVQMTSLIFDQNGNNLTNTAGGANQNISSNLGNLDLSNLLQNIGVNLNANTNMNTNTNNNINANANINTNNNSTSEPQNQQNTSSETNQQSNPYPILNDTNNHISNLGSLINQINGNLSNNEVPNVPPLNYPVNILTTFGTTLKNYHNNLQRLLPFINQLSDLLQRESLLSNPQDRQNANKLAKNILTGIKDISGANKMIETFLTGLEFGNRPTGGMVTFIQGSINQIQLVGEAVDELNNSSPISLNINFQNNPNNINIPNSNANNTNLNSTTNISQNNNSNINSVGNDYGLNANNNNENNSANPYPNLTSNTSNSVNRNSSQTTSNTANSEPSNKKEEKKENQDSLPNHSTNSSARPAAGGAGGLNSLLGNLMSNLGNNNSSSASTGGRAANPLGNLGSLVNNIMSNPETSGLMSNMMSSLSKPGAQNNLGSMFGSLMSGMNAGNNQAGGQPNLGNLLSSIMGNLGNKEDDEEDVEDFELNPEVKKLCENKNNWKKTKLADLKKALEMTKKPQFKEFVEILLEFTIDEFHFLKRLQFDGLTRQAEKIREKINNYLKKQNKDLNQFKSTLVEIFNENFILAEDETHKIISEGFDLEKYSTSFISDLVDFLFKENLNEQELNSKIHKRVVEFLGLVFNELKMVYSTEREGALYYFAENLGDFIQKNFGDDSFDNLLEINEDVFEEMIANAVDIYDQNQRSDLLKKKNNEKANNNQSLELSDMNQILAIADQDEKRFGKNYINFSDDYKKTSLFKD